MAEVFQELYCSHHENKAPPLCSIKTKLILFNKKILQNNFGNECVSLNSQHLFQKNVKTIIKFS